MKRILCTGDSHTWGQGAVGLTEEFSPPVQAGDLRLAGFRTGGYVNRLRRMVEGGTGSYSREWRAQELAEVFGVKYREPCAIIRDQTVTMSFDGALLRVEYSRGDLPCRFGLAVDGTRMAGETEPAASGSNDYRIVTLHLPDAPHILELTTEKGEFQLYRIESYGGAAAVINGGIGSCPAFRFREKYFADYVAAVRPDLIIAEAHTINDWLTGAAPDVYAAGLRALLKDFLALKAEVILLTVSPISGVQTWEGGAPYEDYVQASRDAVRQVGVPVCDANRIMTLGIAGMSDREADAWLFADQWHVNDRGHAIYAEMLFQMLMTFL